MGILKPAMVTMVVASVTFGPALPTEVASAQEQTPPGSDPASERARDMERQLEAAGENRTVAPSETIQAVPRAGEDPNAFRTPLLREGAFLTERPGRLVFDEAIGFWVFEAEPEHTPTTAAHRIPLRFIMLPSTRLRQMQRTVEAGESEVRFLLTGRVFVYEDNNYLLPLDATILEQYDSAEESPADDEEAADQGEPEAGQGGADEEPSAEELISRVREEVPIARALAPPDDEPGVEGAATLAEGRLITGRRGRVVRNARGGWEFIFTADSDGLEDPPMTLLPCLLLERMQRDAQRREVPDTLLVTGEVYVYRGRNYLLPTMYRIERFTENIRR